MTFCAAVLHATDPIAELALAAPPEFAADAMLRLVESKRIANPKEAVSLLQQAFDLASQAKFRAMRRPVNVEADSRESTLAKAYALKLDAISLQARAVVEMAALDGTHARQMFTSAVKPAVGPQVCPDALAYDFLDYYQALTVVVNRGFNAKERGKEDHVAFLVDAVSQVQSPAQFAPIEQAIGASGLTPVQRELVMAKLESLKQTLPPTAACQKTAEANSYWKSDYARRILSEGQSLRANPQISLDHLADIEKDLAAWGPANETSMMDYYQQKCIAYEALVELTPSGIERDRLVEEFVAFITHSDVQRESAVEWFMPAERMLERVRNSNDGEPGKVLEAFELSGNPILVLRTATERAFDQGHPGWAVPMSSR
jgi:hypothetical protein